MPDANTHLDYIDARLADVPALARFASRLSVTASGDEIVVVPAGPSAGIRATGQGFRLGSDEIDLSSDPQEPLKLVARRLGFRPTQMDG